MWEVQESLLLRRELPERRLGHAQAGVLRHDCVWREMVPVGDNPPGGADPHQEENAEGQMRVREAAAHRGDAVARGGRGQRGKGDDGGRCCRTASVFLQTSGDPWPQRPSHTLFSEDEELSHLGTAVYPDVALINHSCLPSVIVTYNGTSADVRAVRDMNPGDEVLISYIDVLYPTEDRNTRLRESYYFTCQCQECGSQSSDQAKLKLRKRSDPAEAEVINTMVRYARKCIREFRVFKNSNTPASTLLEMCEQSLDEMGAVFDESNVYMLHMMYQAMGVCLYMQDPDGALRYGEKIAKYYRKLYPAYSLNLSSLYLKLGRLYFGMERNSECISVLKKAKAIMEVTHGKNHFYVTELDRQMKE
ncbi:unnamed protein product, partial [Tetraodon nigroviridis]